MASIELKVKPFKSYTEDWVCVAVAAIGVPSSWFFRRCGLKTWHHCTQLLHSNQEPISFDEQFVQRLVIIDTTNVALVSYR